MKRSMSAVTLAVFLVVMAVRPERAIADTSPHVYRSVGADGSVHFSTQPHDASYELFLKGTSSTPSLGPVAPRVPAPVVAYGPLIEQAAREHGVDSDLVKAVVHVESRSRPSAVSRKGAVGLMQLMPATARQYGVTRPTDPWQNIEAGVRHLRYLLDLHQGNIPLALAAYNAGEGRVGHYGQRVPPYAETLQYVASVGAYRAMIRQSVLSSSGVR